MKEAIMEVTQDIEKFLETQEVTKIQGQPFKNDVTKLQKELGQITQKLYTILLDENHGNLELIMEEVSYWKISNRRVSFVIPNNTGVYLDVPASVTTAQWERLVAEHKAEVAEYEKGLNVTNALTLKICEAVLI